MIFYYQPRIGLLSIWRLSSIGFIPILSILCSITLLGPGHAQVTTLKMGGWIWHSQNCWIFHYILWCVVFFSTLPLSNLTFTFKLATNTPGHFYWNLLVLPRYEPYLVDRNLTTERELKSKYWHCSPFSPLSPKEIGASACVANIWPVECLA